MNYDAVIDSYAWIEYFRGTEEGESAREYVENKSCVTASITIAELAEKYKKENKNFEVDFKFIISKTKIFILSNEIAKLSGEINFENKKKIKNWGMSDSIILATSQRLNTKVLTGDPHFKDLNSIMLNELSKYRNRL